MRPFRLLAAAAALAGAATLTLAAGTASAGTYDLACNYDHFSFNACLNFDEPVLNSMTVNVGLDEVMPESRAREIIAAGAHFAAQLYWIHGGQSTFITDLTIAPGWPAAGPNGLGAEMVADIPKAALDRNPRAGEVESFYAVIEFYDFHGAGQWVSHPTGTVTGDFQPQPDGGPGGSCLVAC
jgi:hypothetical protein